VLAPGNLQSHTFCGLGDQDWLEVSLQGGQVYQFSTLNLGADTDTLLSLYDANGNLLAESDDLNSANLASSILYHPPANATAYLRVVDTDARVGGNAVSYDILGASVQVLFLPSIFR
jgi:flagellar capping protein FliD